MTYTDKQIQAAALDMIMSVIDRENNGMYAKRTTSDRSIRILRECNVRVKSLENIVYRDNEPWLKIKRNYSKRKTNGCYKQLKPSLIEL